MQVSSHTVVVLILSFLISYESLGQNETPLDSILLKGAEYESKGDYKAALKIYEKQLSKHLSIQEETQLLSKIGGTYYKLKEYQKSKSFYYKATIKDTSSHSLIKNYLGLSYCYKKMQLRDSSIYYANMASNKNQTLFKSYNQTDSEYKIAFIYKSFGLNEKALSLYLSASNGFKQFNDRKKLANIYNEIAFIHRLQGNIETSLNYYHKGRYSRQKLEDSKGLSLAYNNLGNGHKSLMNLDSANYYYQNSLKIKQKNSYLNQGFNLHNLGTVFFLKEDLQTSKVFYRKALEAKKKDNDTITLIYSYNELALIAIEENDLKLGSVYLDSSKTYIQGNNESTLRWYELQKNLHYKQENYIQAYQYQEDYIKTYKALYNTQKTKTIIDNQEKHETKKRVKKIENLTEENKLTTKTLTRRTLYLTGTIILLLILLITYLINKQRQKLITQKEDIKNLRKLFKSQDIVRNKIGRDLHDIVKSKYEGIRLMIISLYRSSNLKNDIKEITQEIAEANEQVRMLSHRLSPLDQRIQHSTLNQIIRAELNKFQLYTDIDVSITEEFPQEWNSMRLEAQNHLYGIFLEAINNVRDHSKASEIVITPIIIDEEYSYITISDNGIGKGGGFKEGIGIGNMKSRAKLINGNLTIKSSISGFSISLEFPLNINKNEEA